MTSEEKPLTGDGRVKDVADYLSMHPETVRTMARSGDFPNAYKTNGRTSPIRIPWKDVQAWREKQPRANR